MHSPSSGALGGLPPHGPPGARRQRMPEAGPPAAAALGRASPDPSGQQQHEGFAPPGRLSTPRRLPPETLAQRARQPAASGLPGLSPNGLWS